MVTRPLSITDAVCNAHRMKSASRIYYKIDSACQARHRTQFPYVMDECVPRLDQRGTITFMVPAVLSIFEEYIDIELMLSAKVAHTRGNEALRDRKALFDNDRLPCRTSDPILSEEATKYSSLNNVQYVAISGFLRGVNRRTDTTSSTVVLIVTHYYVTVIMVRLALATALIALKQMTLSWRRSVRLVGRSEDDTKLSEAHRASQDLLARFCRRRFQLCLRGRLCRVRVVIRLSRVYHLEVIIFKATRRINA